MRTSVIKQIHNTIFFVNQLQQWANKYSQVVVLDSNDYKQRYSEYDFVVAVDAYTFLETSYHNAFSSLHHYQSQINDWIFGAIGYDAKNDIEKLYSHNYDGLQFPDLYFFQPKKLFFIKDNILQIEYINSFAHEIEADFIAINSILVDELSAVEHKIDISQRITQEKYIEKVQKMLAHIHRGDIYEANFCMEFFAENCKIKPLDIFNKLNKLSKAPFSVYFKNNQHYVLCASPERYLKKTAENVISQPIKGTAKRFDDIEKDKDSRQQLEQSSKERSENIMIVDLVRNDLSRTAQKNSVQVEELCKVYTFKQVHQMISTIISNVDKAMSPVQVIKTTFPMGSMTGAPKISAMKIIEELEETKRGLYSGAIGYITPQGDFDFNVVIRSILYNEANKYLSFSVGSAITALSNPVAEYEECLVKARAMFQVLQSK